MVPLIFHFIARWIIKRKNVRCGFHFIYTTLNWKKNCSFIHCPLTNQYRRSHWIRLYPHYITSFFFLSINLQTHYLLNTLFSSLIISWLQLAWNSICYGMGKVACTLRDCCSLTLEDLRYYFAWLVPLVWNMRSFKVVIVELTYTFIMEIKNSTTNNVAM